MFCVGSLVKTEGEAVRLSPANPLAILEFGMKKACARGPAPLRITPGLRVLSADGFTLVCESQPHSNNEQVEQEHPHDLSSSWRICGVDEHGTRGANPELPSQLKQWDLAEQLSPLLRQLAKFANRGGIFAPCKHRQDLKIWRLTTGNRLEFLSSRTTSVDCC